jgi:predicted anti-sigma-YlaC factor YlaD
LLLMDELDHGCERACFWLSLRLDDELSELEGALLDAHLARCAGCQAVAVGFGASTRVLRSATLECIAPLAVELPRSPRPWRTALLNTRKLRRDIAAESV